jgi:hypothetical protein
MALFPDDVSDTMTKILVKRNSMWAAKIASQNTTSTMHQHHANTRCICESCSDARPQPQVRPSMRIARVPDPHPSAEGVGRVVTPIVRPPLNPPVQSIELGNGLVFALRLMSGPNRRPR